MRAELLTLALEIAGIGVWVSNLPRGEIPADSPATHGLAAEAPEAAIERLLDCNEQLLQMVGYSRAELIGQPVAKLLAGEERARALEKMRAGGDSRSKHFLICRDGRRLLVEAHAGIFVSENSAVRITAVQDISGYARVEADLRAATLEAERADRAKSRFLAAASHDLRQPLSALSVYVQMLKEKLTPVDQPVATRMRDCVASLSELLTDLLDLSKLEARVVTPCVTDFAINDVLSHLQSVHAPDAEAKGLRLRCVPSRWIGRTDLVLFRRALGNLIDNALRYTERGGVLIACRRRQGKTWVEVRDSGIGIAAGKEVEIFEEFKQLDNGGQGSGLGLAIVAKTASLLGLEIRVSSRPGKGSLFAIELPLGQIVPSLPAATVPTAHAKRLRIALVEDNTMVREALAKGLQGFGHQVIASASKATLLAALRAAGDAMRPHIVISDYRLADGENGFEVTTAVRAQCAAEVPAILITGDTDPRLLSSMSERGIVVLHKPVDLETLQAHIEDLTYPFSS